MYFTMIACYTITSCTMIACYTITSYCVLYHYVMYNDCVLYHYVILRAIPLRHVFYLCIVVSIFTLAWRFLGFIDMLWFINWYCLFHEILFEDCVWAKTLSMLDMEILYIVEKPVFSRSDFYATEDFFHINFSPVLFKKIIIFD